MANTTPFVKRMRTQGGTIFTFSSALEDIGLNINERNNVVKMSHYALLNIPNIGVPANLQENKFNVFAIPGAWQSQLNSGNIKDSRVIVAESFQDYALNLETNLLSQTSYNASLQTTIAERVFWKWLKETGAIRWNPIDTSAGTYWQEENLLDSSIGYSSVVKAIGQISAGSVRTDTFGTYNETYVLVPTSFGETPVYFKQFEDDNYYHGLSTPQGYTNILGRQTYLKPHPDALDIKAYYDLPADSSGIGPYTFQYDNSTGSWANGWWWSFEGFPTAEPNRYFVDSSEYIISKIYDINLRYQSGNSIAFKRSKVDCLSIELNLTNLQTIFNDPTMTFDSLALQPYSEDTQYDFNSILIYYSVYNKSLDKVLATNLLGIMFLDPPSGNTAQYTLSDIVLPSITKLQSGPSGFGTSYAFRINVKSDYMIDDTAATINDETTTSQLVLEDFSTVFDSLGKSLTILNQQSGTIAYITGQYLEIAANQTNLENEVTDIQNQLNTLTRDITGTPGSLSMFIEGDDPIGDSSIYMYQGNVGIFNPKPTWPIQFDASLKTKEIYIENAIRDTSGNLLLGYGSPLTIGSSTYTRSLSFYTGSSTPAMMIDSSGHMTLDPSIKLGNYVSESSLGTYFYWDASGNLEPSVGSGGSGNALSSDASIVIIKATYIPNASLGTGFSWSLGYLSVNVSVAGGGVSQTYVDQSLGYRDTSIAWLNTNKTTWSVFNTSLGTYALNSSVNVAFNAYATNASIGIAAFASNASLGAYATNASIAAAAFVKANGTSFTGIVHMDVAGGTSITNETATDNTTQIATDQFVQSRVALTDTSVAWLNTNKLSKSDTSVGFGAGNWTIDSSGTYLRFRYNGVVKMLFTSDGSILALGNVTGFTSIA
jgi:hypothetical protein